MIIKEFNNWCRENAIDIYIESNQFDFFSFSAILLEDQEFVLNEDMSLRYDGAPKDIYIFKFGDEFFYRTDLDDRELNLFVNIGESTNKDYGFPQLGISCEYAMDGTVGMSRQYIEKAKFLGAPLLGYTALNSMAGSLVFQNECDKQDIKCIHGIRLSVLIAGITSEVILYASNNEAIRNLLRICNEKSLLYREEHIPVEAIKPWLHQMIWVWNVEGYMSESFEVEFLTLNNEIKNITGNPTYTRIHSTQYADDKRDDKYLKALRKYVYELAGMVPPILIEHPQYVHPSQFMAPLYLRKIQGISDQFQTNAFLKTAMQSRLDLADVFTTSDVLKSAVSNAVSFTELYSSRIDVETKKLPDFKMSRERADQVGYRGDLEDTPQIYKFLISRSWKTLQTVVGNKEQYIKRIKHESDVILKHDLQDYFLILWDIVYWCGLNDILVGIGRGSAGGSLVSYLLGITKLDPIKHGLLFERFLNEGRLGPDGDKPDIDIDLEVSRRLDVKKYLSDKYGANSVCAVGTYSRMWSKSVIQATYRAAGVNYKNTLDMSNALPHKATTERYSYSDLWRFAMNSKISYDVMQAYPDATKSINAYYSQIINSSIHACATIICPDYTSGVKTDLRFEVPLRMEDGQIVSMWEGSEMDDAGFLKLDLLGLSELDKLKNISVIIEQYCGESTDPLNPDYEDEASLSLYRMGLTQQIFQMSSQGLKKLATRAQPRSVDDLSDIIALYRPGPMSTGAHSQWADINAGIKPRPRDPHLDAILNQTNGILIYQESVMRIASEICGFTLVEADNLRKAVGKKKADEMAKIEDSFIQGGLNNFYEEDYLRELWSKIVGFSEYGFNRSHSYAYAQTGFCGMWYKANYPLFFYTVALNMADQKEVSPIIYEIESNFPDIKIAPPDINKSGFGHIPDPTTNTIYWSIDGIKGLGEKATQAIIEEREAFGSFLNLKDFIERMKGKGVAGGAAETLVLAGAFDNVYKIQSITQRLNIVATLYKGKMTSKEFPDAYRSNKASKTSYWSLQQRGLLGFGKIDVTSIAYLINESIAKKITSTEIACANIQDKKKVVIGGVVTSTKEKTSRNDKLYGLVQLEDGGPGISAYIWGDAWVAVRQKVNKAKSSGSAVILEGAMGTFQGMRTLSVGDQDTIIVDE